MLHIKLAECGVDIEITDKDGNDLSGVVAICDIELRSSARGMSTATILVETMKAEINDGEVYWMTKHPVSQEPAEIDEITFKDGTRVVFDPHPRVVGP